MTAGNGNGHSASRIGRLWRRLWMNPALTWGCEISPSGVCVARWRSGSSGLEAAAWRPLAERALAASPLHENLQRVEEVRQGLAGCLESLGRPPGPSAGFADAALVIPDQAARLFFLSLDQLPRDPAEAVALVRWKLKKSVPFDVESARVSYFARLQQGQWELIAVVSPEPVIRQYEDAAESVGLKPRFVTLTTLASLGLIPASPGAPDGLHGESVLLAKYSPPWFTTAIVHGGFVCLFRTVPIGNPENGAARTEVLEAIYPSVAYFQDNFETPLAQVFLSGLGEGADAIADSLSKDLNLSARPLAGDFRVPVAGLDRPHAERHLAALLGIVREQRRR